MVDVARIRERVCEAYFYGPLIQNNYRSAWVEFMVVEALGRGWSVCSGGWAGWDLEGPKGIKLEVKQSAARQTWCKDDVPKKAAKPCFDIATRSGYWEKGDTWVLKAGRYADIYVFAWHPIVDARADHTDPFQWTFAVVAATKLPPQKTIGLKPLLKLSPLVGIRDLSSAVHSVSACIS